MPKRPQQHISGEQGLAEVVRILSNSGWACDVVRADYGEDLICQTSLDGNVDAHRILIQVKSTVRLPPKGGYTLTIKKDTIVKWLSDPNLVVVCLWCSSTRTALYTIPAQQFSLTVD